jgi:hypothetical protein
MKRSIDLDLVQVSTFDPGGRCPFVDCAGTMAPAGPGDLACTDCRVSALTVAEIVAADLDAEVVRS